MIRQRGRVYGLSSIENRAIFSNTTTNIGILVPTQVRLQETDFACRFARYWTLVQYMPLQKVRPASDARASPDGLLVIIGEEFAADGRPRTSQ